MSQSAARPDTAAEVGEAFEPGRPTRSALAAIRPHAGPALRVFFRLAVAWDLTSEEQRALLGQPAKTTFYRWRHGETGAVTVDLMERLSHLLAIYGALHSLYLEHGQADAWIRRPNDAPLFGGRAPLDRLLGGRVADLYEVRRYLEAAAEPAF
ncbi:MAG: antitoxin Xre/MbcA/ParS toxin-binding domain-containing protein [Longimicrobiaceae bacterium]